MHIYKGNSKQFGSGQVQDSKKLISTENFCQMGMVLSVLTGLTIPVSTTLTSVLSLGVLSCWIISGQYLVSFDLLKKYRLASASVMLFGFLAIGLLYTPESLSIAAKNLFKYRQFILIPIYLSFFLDPKSRYRGIQMFELAMIITLIGSLACWVGSIDGSARLIDRSIFKNRITQNILMAFLVYLAAWKFLENPRRRWGYAILAIIATFNIVAIVPGRSGYLALGILICVLMCQKWGYKGIIPAVFCVGGVGLFAYNQSETFQMRINQVISEIKEYRTSQKRRSVDQRLEFYENSLQLAKANPFFGAGIGSFSSKYHQLAHEKGQLATSNPHNEYVMLLVQNGVIGVSLFLYFFWVSSRSIQLLNGLDRALGQAVIAVYFVGCMVNSLMLDTTEGSLFGFLIGLTFAGGVSSIRDHQNSVQEESTTATQDSVNDKEAA